MILKGSQRAGAVALAAHLTNARDNDHVEVLNLDGFLAEDLRGAFREIEAVSKGTRCKQYLFSLSLNPPADQVLTDDQFRDVVRRAEEVLGLQGQPRAIVLHEKEGRRHAHAVWSRIDAQTMTAINLPHFKNRLRDLSRELYLDHGWDLPKGLQTLGGRSPLNFSLAEWQQAKRIGVDPREIRQVFRQAWSQTESLIGFKNALEDRGYFLARGDRRGFVALDVEANVYAIPKWTGLKTRDVREKLGQPDDLPSVEAVRSNLRSRVSEQMRDYIVQTKARHGQERSPFVAERSEMVASHREERWMLAERQADRWKQETKARSERLNTGLRGLFDRLTGAAAATRKTNEAEAFAAYNRDQAQKQALIEAQMKERRTLQEKVVALRERQKQDRQRLARDVAASLARLSQFQKEQDNNTRSRTRSRNVGLRL